MTSVNCVLLNVSHFNSNLSDWDVPRATDVECVFFEASNFNSNLHDWNASSVTGMEFMFYCASNFNSDLSAWNASRHAIFFRIDLSNDFVKTPLLPSVDSARVVSRIVKLPSP